MPEEETIERILRDRLGGGPPRHRPRGRRRADPGPPEVSDDAAGLARLLELPADHGDSPDNPVTVAIETPRGLLAACLRATGRRVCPVKPMSVARYRDRHSVAGRKPGKGDAAVLANVLRTDLHAHRPLPADSELAQAVAVLARARQDAVWDRTTAHNKLRSHLREHYPGFLAAFAAARGGIMRPEARAVLAAAPTPAAGARLTPAQLRALLKKAGRSRGIDAEAQRLRDALPTEQMRQLPLVEEAMGRQSVAVLGDPETSGIHARASLDRINSKQDNTRAAPNTANRKRAVLNNLMTYAERERKLILGNPLKSITWTEPRKLKTVDPRCVLNPEQGRRFPRDRQSRLRSGSHSGR
jgi:hypothetical protein